MFLDEQLEKQNYNDTKEAAYCASEIEPVTEVGHKDILCTS